MFEHLIIGLQTVIPLLIRGVMIKTVELTLQLLMLWPLLDMEFQHRMRWSLITQVVVLYPSLIAAGGTTHVCMFSQTELNWRTLPCPWLNIST